MKQLLSLAAMGCSLSLIEAGGFKWNSNKAHDLGGYTPAHETGDLQMQLQPVTANPEPTSPPELRRSKVPVAERRDSTVPGSVCGYMSHDLDSTLACAYDNTCLFTTFGASWVAGCCPTTSTNCAIATTCVDSSVGESMSYIGVSTYWCSYESFPVCVTLSFQDVPGYTIYNCGGSEVITSQSIDHSLDPADTITSTSTDDNDDDDIATATSASGSARRSSTTTTTPTPTTASPTPSPKSSTPIGAIVGGAVGGVALIVILILGIVFLVRGKNGKKGNNPPPHAGGYHHPDQAPPPPITGQGQGQGQAPPYPMMQQQQQQAPPAAFAPAADNSNNRYSMQKAPYDVNTQSVYAPTLSTPGSPPPPPHSPGSPGPVVIQGHQPAPSGSPPPMQQGQGLSPADSTFQVSQQNTGSTHAFHNNNNNNNQYSQHNPAYHEVHEMSATGRPDRELRELSGDPGR